MLSALPTLTLPLLLSYPISPGNEDIGALVICPGFDTRFELMEPGRRYDTAPTNTSVWLHEYVSSPERGALRLVSSNTQQAVEVEQSRTFMRNSNLMRMKPVQPLEPNAGYTIFEGERELGRFRTGAEPDNTRPDAPELMDVNSGNDRCTGQSLNVQLSNLDDEVFYQIEAGQETLGANNTNFVSFFVGQDETPMAMQAFAIDLAGNRSVPSLPFEGPVGCVCASAPPTRSSFALLLLVGLGFFRARASREAGRAS